MNIKKMVAHQWMLPALLLGLITALVAPANAQGPRFDLPADIGKYIPATLKLQDIAAPGWMHMTVVTVNGAKPSDNSNPLTQLMQLGALSSGGKGGDSLAGLMGLSAMGGSTAGGGNDPVYYTKMQLGQLGGEIFLIAYKVQKKGLNLAQMIADSAANGGKDPDFNTLLAQNKVTADTLVTLTLINIKTLAQIGSIRPTEVSQEIAESNEGDTLLQILAAGNKPTTPKKSAKPAPRTQ